MTNEQLRDTEYMYFVNAAKVEYLNRVLAAGERLTELQRDELATALRRQAHYGLQLQLARAMAS